MKPDTELTNPIFSVSLKLWPRLHNETLRAWDGADLLLLDHLAESAAESKQADGETLILNDATGAITLPLLATGRAVKASGDSWVGHKTLCENAADNDVSTEGLSWAWPSSLDTTSAATVLIRVPKSLALLEYQFRQVAESAKKGTPIIVAAMDKHAPPTLMKLMQRYFSSVDRSRGHRKAHLYFAQTGDVTVPAPTSSAAISVPALGGKEIETLPGVFSGDKLDIGARFFAEHVPRGVAGNVADLGCGNGIIGLVALSKNPESTVWFCDESAQAIHCAEKNSAALFPERQCHYYHGNGLDGLDETFDTILLNPPFHRGYAVDEGVATMLFRHARRHLKPDGTLYVIGNRHLKYNLTLRKLFGNVKEIAANEKFIIWSATF